MVQVSIDSEFVLFSISKPTIWTEHFRGVFHFVTDLFDLSMSGSIEWRDLEVHPVEDLEIKKLTRLSMYINCRYKTTMESIIEETVKTAVKSSRIYDILHKMGGSSELKKKISFESSKPEIELYEIIDLTYELKRIRSGFNSCVYINLCTNNTYYVGYANDFYVNKDTPKTLENVMLSRLSDHRNNGGTKFQSNMTYLFPVVSCVAYFPGDKEDEDRMTILMNKFAGNRVRGGIWDSPFMIPEYPDMTIDEIKNKLLTRTNP